MQYTDWAEKFELKFVYIEKKTTSDINSLKVFLNVHLIAILSILKD